MHFARSVAMRGAVFATLASVANAAAAGQCSVGGRPDGEVIQVEDGTGHGLSRCAAIITPENATAPMPVLFWFHGSGGNAANCGTNPLAKLATEHGFALVCGEAHWGQWDIPDVFANATTNSCEQRMDFTYVENIVAYLSSSGLYDTSRLFFSGCSQGSGFSIFTGSCMKELHPTRVSAFATHSTGLKIRDDGIDTEKFDLLCDDDDCKYFPAYPHAYTDSLGLKACVFDNTEDPSQENPFFYLTSKQLASVWSSLGNKVEEHYSAGGHCQIQDFGAIVTCLDDGTGRLTGSKTSTV